MSHTSQGVIILFSCVLFIGINLTVQAEPVRSRSNNLLQFYEGYRAGGCDLDADGHTGIPDLVLAAEDNFTHCSFNEVLHVDSNPAHPLAMSIGRPPYILSVYGVKDGAGYLIRAASITVSDATGNLMQLDYDEAGRTTSLLWEDLVVNADYTPGTGFSFYGSIRGETISGIAAFASLPVGFPPERSKGLKRNYSDASGFCSNEQKALQESVFGLDTTFWGPADVQTPHMLLSAILSDEAQFPSDTPSSCLCLLRAFTDQRGKPYDDIRIRHIVGLSLVATPLMVRFLQMAELLAHCEKHPLTYSCWDIDKSALRKSIQSTSNSLQFLALMVTAVFMELAADTTECNDSIIFPDPNLEAVVRKAISKPEGKIQPTDLEGLTSLEARYKNIRNLRGIEYAVNLIDLDLEHNQVDDLASLAFLKKLFTLNLNYNQVSDLDPIDSLTNLDQLSLYSNPLRSLQPLGSLPALTLLNVGRCGLTSLGGIETLTTLYELDVRENDIGSLAALVNLVELRKLDVRRTGISDLAPLAGMSNLISLYAHGDKILSVPFQNYISSVGPLQGLKKLNYVGLPGNLITDLTGLVNNLDFAANDQLSIYSNPLSDNARNVQIPALRARGVSVDY